MTNSIKNQKSKNIFRLLLICVFVSIILCFSNKTVFSKEIDSSLILSKADGILSPKPFQGEMEMTVHKSDGRIRSYRMKIFYQSKEKILITFQYPKIEYGRKILSLGNNMWMYLPSVKRTIRISPKQQFLDGDFTNGDVCRLDFTHDYNIENKFDKDGSYELQLKAKNMTIAYSKVIYRIQKETFIPQSQSFYTVSGKLIKTLTISDVKTYLNNLKRPARFYMKDNFVKNKFTTLVYKSLKNNFNIPDYYYYKDNLDKL
jgi:outer membrane lipoprotein-sorting protein